MLTAFEKAKISLLFISFLEKNYMHTERRIILANYLNTRGGFEDLVAVLSVREWVRPSSDSNAIKLFKSILDNTRSSNSSYQELTELLSL